ncbi:MAG: RsmB/NOP family class I SAM-dependent RNA methyltransferase [Alphaproteobacteria bacterium]|nr:RsmB/NOP family class I SAM-dependent RNA methyltransferase [Alphaproteobacteria bacterium]
MTPAARIQAAIVLLGAVLGSSRPADGAISAYFRGNRYIGAKDRHAVASRVWGVMRRRARLSWWIGRTLPRETSRQWKRGIDADGLSPILAPTLAQRDARWLVLADLALTDGMTLDGIALLATDAYGPSGLNQDERDMVRAMDKGPLVHSAMPGWVENEYPEWLEPALRHRFGDRLEAEAAALNGEARLDLRVNTLKASREEALGRLGDEGLEAAPTLLSPLGLRLEARSDLASRQIFRDGWIEVQDEGSQIVALLTGARPGEAVVDYCAGAGGKTLALAAMMGNRGRILACDVSAGRIDRSALRLRRAGAYNVTRRILEGDNDKWVKRKAGTFDRVLVDAPCSGTGTWRRNPDAKWRLRPEGIAELTGRQASILRSASRLVRPGGRLVYATCSILAEENEDRIGDFLSATPAFRLVPAVRAWEEAVGTPYPADPSTPALTLSPGRDGTDGYFIAVMERTG